MQMATSIETDNGEMIVKRVSVPIGLEELMEGLTKEVILKKPKDICVFASEYFSNLLNLREQGSIKGPPGKRIQSVTKRISPNNMAKQLKMKSKSVDPKILSRQTSVQLDSPTKRTLTTKKIVLNSKEEKEKTTEKTKNFLDKRKARKYSRDENNKIPPQISLGQNDKKGKRISRASSTSTEDSTRSPRKSSQSETRKNRSSSKSDKLSPRKTVDLANLDKIGTVATTLTETIQSSHISNKEDKPQDSELFSKSLSNKEYSTEKDINDMSDISVSEDNQNQKSEDVVIGCTMKRDGAVDTMMESVQDLKLVTPTSVEEILTENEHDKTQVKSKDGEEIDNSVDEVDLQKNEIKNEEEKGSDTINETIESDGKPDSGDLKKSSNESDTHTNLNDAVTNQDSQAVETPVEIVSLDTLDKGQVGDQSTEIAENKEHLTTPVENKYEIDKCVDNLKDGGKKLEMCDNLPNPEVVETGNGGASGISEENQVNEDNLVTNDQKSETVKDTSCNIQNENNIDMDKNKSKHISDEGVLDCQENNTEVNITASDLILEDENALQNNEENKENIDINKEPSKDENADETKNFEPTLMSSAATILGNEEIKEAGDSREAAKLKINRTKSSTDEHLKTNYNKTESKKIKRIKSVDSSTKTLTKTKSKSKLNSANLENQEIDTIQKRSKRSASVDVLKDHTTLEETQQSNFNSSKLREEIKEVSDLSKATNFKTSYNPYKLRQEIKQASGDAEVNATSSLSTVASEIAAVIRIQSLWRGFRSRRLIKNNYHCNHGLKANVMPDLSTDQKNSEEVDNGETKSLKESDKLEDKSDQNSTRISNDQIDNSNEIIATEDEETSDNVVKLVDMEGDNDCNKITVEDEMVKVTPSSTNNQNKHETNDEKASEEIKEKLLEDNTEEINDQSNNEENGETIKNKSSETTKEKLKKENFDPEEINDQSKSSEGAEQDNILKEDHLKATIPLEEKSDQRTSENKVNLLKENLVEQEDITNITENESKEEETHNENNKVDVDVNQDSKETFTDENNEHRQKEKEQESLISVGGESQDVKKNDDNILSDVPNKVVTKTEDCSNFSSLENIKQENDDTTGKEMSEKNIEEEIAMKLTSGLNLESSPRLQITKINHAEHDVEQTDNESTQQTPNMDNSVDNSVPSKSKERLDMALAVIKIQALWRGFKARNHLKHEKVFGTTIDKEIKNKEALEIMTRVRAVAKIQALWRGYKVRKNIKEVNKRLAELQKPTECDEMPSQRELSDEDIFKAATKIQAGVRGYIVRKKRNVCHLNSISEETTPDLRGSDEQVIQSIEQLQDVPSHSPELVTNLDDASDISAAKEDSTIVDKTKEETGHGIFLKNNAALNTEEDNKKTENEMKFVASELNSSTTNKLSNLDTSAIIDDSISNTNVNKDGVDPDSSVIHDEPGYEDAPTRPVTSDTDQTNKILETESGENEKKDVQFETENEKETKLNEINKKDKQHFFSSQESTTSVDSIATVIFNDTQTQPVIISEEECDGKLPKDKEEIRPEETKHHTDKIQIESKEGDELENQNMRPSASINDLHKDAIENLTEINNNTHDVKVGVKDVSVDVETTPSITEMEENQLSTENTELNKKELSDNQMETEEESNHVKQENEHVEDQHVETSRIEKSDSENKQLNSKDEKEEKECSDDATNQLLIANVNNKINISALENEIKSSNKSLDVNEKSLSEDSSSQGKTSSENTLNDAIVSQLSLENINNKLNVSALESEIGNSNQKLQDLVARSSEELSENLDNGGKESSLDDSSTDDIKTENSLRNVSPSENINEINDQNNAKEEEKEAVAVQSGKDILRIHIPLRELSEIKEEDGDVKSSTESVEDLEDESKTSSVNQESENRSKESVSEKLKDGPIEVEANDPVDDNKRELIDNANIVETIVSSGRCSEEQQEDAHVKIESSKLEHEEFVQTQPTTQEEPRQKSPVATINLVHSGEFHDTITVPISLTPPTSAAPKAGDNQANVREAGSPGLVNTGELHDNVLPLSVQLNEAPPAGAEVLTSHLSESIITDGQDPAQASNKDASPCGTQPDNTTSSAASMETEKRNNATTIPKKNMEAEAATKIQAGFRGYQVRKQLKGKISSPGDISNQRRSARRKSSGRINESGRITQNKSSKPSAEIEEKSAVKIQAGVRGFLVRRRQKKQKQGKESS